MPLDIHKIQLTKNLQKKSPFPLQVTGFDKIIFTR